MSGGIPVWWLAWAGEWGLYGEGRGWGDCMLRAGDGGLYGEGIQQEKSAE